MDFVGLTINCEDDQRELIIAELSLYPFLAFEELPGGLSTYCEIQDWDEAPVKEICQRYDVSYDWKEIEKINWNTEWEKNYDSILVENRILVRATFHPSRPEIPLEIIINPQMSFGTGHHSTTYLVLAYQLQLDHQGKRVLDIGCGTGILSIMAHKQGAASVTAVDIDTWCIENSRENFSLNNCEDIDLRLGGKEVLTPDDCSEIVLANINKNTHLDLFPLYKQLVNEEGILVLSGFYKEDVTELLSVAMVEGFELIHSAEKENWAVMGLRRVNS